MKNLKFLAVALTILFAASCSNDSTTPNTYGNVTVKITDAPMHYDQFMKATITIDKIEIGNSRAPGSFVLLTNKQMKVNLLGLVNGITQTMASIDIPEGDYNMLRLYISSTEMEMKNGTDFTYNMAQNGFSGSGMMQNGMMLNSTSKSIDIPLDSLLKVANGSMHEFLVDVDVERSFMLEGVTFSGTGSSMMMQMTGFTFSPMLRFVNMQNAGTFQGTVQGPAGVLADATVTLMHNGIVYTTTHTNIEGKYALIGIPAGTYTIKAEKNGYSMNPVGNEANMVPLNMTAGSKMMIDFSMIVAN